MFLLEFPNGQSQLINALSPVLSDEDCESSNTILRDKARGALDRVFDDFDVDVLIMPQDCRVSTISAEAGYPAGIAPLGYSSINGRGFGLVILAKAGREDKILEFMSSWEAENPGLLVPPRLEDDGR